METPSGSAALPRRLSSMPTGRDRANGSISLHESHHSAQSADSGFSTGLDVPHGALTSRVKDPRTRRLQRPGVSSLLINHRDWTQETGSRGRNVFLAQD